LTSLSTMNANNSTHPVFASASSPAVCATIMQWTMVLLVARANVFGHI
jgi:hypothetical protein